MWLTVQAVLLLSVPVLIQSTTEVTAEKQSKRRCNSSISEETTVSLHAECMYSSSCKKANDQAECIEIRSGYCVCEIPDEIQERKGKSKKKSKGKKKSTKKDDKGKAKKMKKPGKEGTTKTTTIPTTTSTPSTTATVETTIPLVLTPAQKYCIACVTAYRHCDKELWICRCTRGIDIGECLIHSWKVNKCLPTCLDFRYKCDQKYKLCDCQNFTFFNKWTYSCIEYKQRDECKAKCETAFQTCFTNVWSCRCKNIYLGGCTHLSMEEATKCRPECTKLNAFCNYTDMSCQCYDGYFLHDYSGKCLNPMMVKTCRECTDPNKFCDISSGDCKCHLGRYYDIVSHKCLPPCKHMWYQLAYKCYRQIKYRVIPQNLRVECKKMVNFSTLIMPKNRRENVYIASKKAFPLSKDYWFFMDLHETSNYGTLFNRKFIWYDGDRVKFQNWDYDQPSRYIWARCVAMFSLAHSAGRWATFGCDGKHAPFCEYKLQMDGYEDDIYMNQTGPVYVHVEGYVEAFKHVENINLHGFHAKT